MSDRAFPFLCINERQAKPPEIRGPYYTPMGRRRLEDLLETMRRYIDSLKRKPGVES
jgi:hypothetical protein